MFDISGNIISCYESEAYHLEASKFFFYVGDNAGVFQPTNQNQGIFLWLNMESVDWGKFV